MNLYPIMGVMMGVGSAYGATDKEAPDKAPKTARSLTPDEYFHGHWESKEQKVFLLTDLWMRKVLISETKAKPPIYETEKKGYEDQLLNRFTWSMATKTVVKLAYGKDINDIQAGKLSRLLWDANGVDSPVQVLRKEWPLTGAQKLISILSYLRCNQLSVYQGRMDSNGKWGVFPDRLRIQVPEGFEDALNKLLASRPVEEPKPAPVVKRPARHKRLPAQPVSLPVEAPKKKRSWKVF